MRLSLFTAVTMLSVSLAAHATQITYTQTATASGSLGGVRFTNDLLTITGLGDTAAATNPSAGIYRVATTVEGTVAGIGTFTFLGLGDYFSNKTNDTVGVETFAPILETHNPAFADYDLTSAIGPLMGLSSISPGTTFETTGGNLDLTSAGNSTFQATTTSITPEPSSLLLLGTGLLGVTGMVRKRFTTITQ